VEFGLRRRGLERALMDQRVREALELVQLTGKEDRLPAQLSGGEKQRVALARSLVLQPDVLLLDEPLSALDSNLRKQVRAELRELQRRVGVTFVLVTHDQEEALSTSDRIAIMNAGRIEQVGTPQHLYLQPKTRFIAGFLGDVNCIGQVGVRPEAMRIARQAPAQEVRSIPSVVETLTFLGNTIHVHAKSAAGQRITAEVSRLDDGLKPGEAVHVWWRPSDEIHTPSDR
jgi:ABC-type Fe3+/spermidine/putrescine transport system ATPase subunit